MTVPLSNLTDTWNASGTTWKGIQLNVTDTGHAAASRLIDLQVGGTTQFDVDASGTVGFATDVQFNVGGSNVMDYNVSRTNAWSVPASGIIMGGAASNPVGIARNAANLAEINNGVAGGFVDLKIRTLFVAHNESGGTDALDLTNASGHHWILSDGTGNASKGPYGNNTFALYDVTSGIGFGYGANILFLGGGPNAQSLHVYNTYSDSSNYERGVLDWATTSNVLTIGTQAAGTGTLRNLDLKFGQQAGFKNTGNSNVMFLNSLTSSVGIYATYGFAWGSGGDPSSGVDTTLSRVTNSVVGVGSSVSVVDGFLQWGGQKRVTSDFSVTSSAVLTNVTGLSLNVQAGRTYSFIAYLSCTCAAAGGVKAAIAGTATVTSIIYDGYVLDTNSIKGQANATALGGTVASSTTTATSGLVIEIQGTITVNVAGSLTVQFAQNTSNGTASVVKRGSWFLVHDMP